MEITCVLYGTFQETVGRRSIEYDLPADSTVEAVLERLTAEFPDLDISLEEDWRHSTQVTRNRTHIHHEDGLETELADGDVVRIFSPVTGG